MTIKIHRILSTAAALAVLVPGVASASTITLDDDRAQCPSAGFTDLQAAINQAAPWDTIKICAGTYTGVTNAPSTPPTANSPAQAGSKNGFVITKPLTLKGAGADKVTIKPAASAGTTLAGTAPYLRDGGGAVIAINRQSLGSSDFTENFVTISGVTVSSPDGTYAESGVQFFNTSGRISNSVVGPLYRPTDAADLAAKPYGYGVLMSNLLQGAGETTVRREVYVENSTVTGYAAGGIRFDDARGTDASTTATQRSGILGYGFVSGSKILGSGPDSLIPQVGIQYHAGQRGSVVGNTIANNSFTPDARKSVGVLLTDAEVGTDPSNPPTRAFFARTNSITGNGWGVVNANITNDGARPDGASVQLTGPSPDDENWFGCASGPVIGSASVPPCDSVSGPAPGPAVRAARAAGDPSVELGAPRSSPPPPAVGATSVADASPTGSIVNPGDGDSTPVNVAVPVDVVAADDFGVKSVTVKVDGVTLGTDTTAPYEVVWTPGFADLGPHTISATVTDASDQSTLLVPVSVTVPTPPGYVALTATPASWDFGTVQIGSAPHKLFTLKNTGQNPVTLTSIGLTGSPKFAVNAPPGTCTGSTVLAVDATCTVDASFTPADDQPQAGTLSVGYTATGGTSPVSIPLTGKGKATVDVPTTATVDSTLGLTVSAPSANLGSFLPGVAQDYTAGLTVGVTTTGAASSLLLTDPSSAATGRLVNGAYSLAQPVQAKATNTAQPSGSFGPVGSTLAPLTLLSYPGPVSNDPVAVTLKQSISSVEPLRTGTYAKTLLFTLATTTP